MPLYADNIRAQAAERLKATESLTMNAYRGKVTGDGIIRNTFVHGDLQIARGAVVANCRIDKGVTLIVEEGAQLIDCHFHPYMCASVDKAMPVVINIGKNTVCYKVWFSEDCAVGNDCTLYWTAIGSARWDFGCDKAPDGNTIGDGCIIYKGYITGFKERERNDSYTGVSLGNHSIVWEGKLTANSGSQKIGDNAVICSYTEMLQHLLNKTMPANVSTDYRIPRVLNHGSEFPGICAYHTDVIMGDNACITVCHTMHSSFEKVKEPSRFEFGNNVHLCTAENERRGNNAPQLFAHSCKVGDDVTICLTGQAWYHGCVPIRNIEIGSHSIVRVRANRDNTFKGSDIRIPANSTALL